MKSNKRQPKPQKPDSVPAYMRCYAAGQKASSLCEQHLMAKSPHEAWLLTAISALAHFRKSAKLCRDSEAKAMILGMAAKWANQTNQPKLAIELLDQGIEIASDEIGDKLRDWKRVIELDRGMKRIITPAEASRGS